MHRSTQEQLTRLRHRVALVERHNDLLTKVVNDQQTALRRILAATLMTKDN